MDKIELFAYIMVLLKFYFIEDKHYESNPLDFTSREKDVVVISVPYEYRVVPVEILSKFIREKEIEIMGKDILLNDFEFQYRDKKVLERV